MQKRLLSALAGIALLMTLCINVFAAYNDAAAESQADSSVAFTTTEDRKAVQSAAFLLDAAFDTGSPIIAEAETTDVAVGPKLTVNGLSTSGNVVIKTVDDTTYVSVRTMIEALDPDAEVNWQNGQLVASGNGYRLTAKPGDFYLVVNGRYLYVPNEVRLESGATLAPLRTICTALGASTQWDVMTQDISVTTGGDPLKSGDSFYTEEDLYWLSRIITAESRNQPLKGKIAVGNVIMNRVESEKFPNTVYDVIFSGNQFTPTQNGSIYNQPTTDSVIAAKLVLDGAEEAGDSLFFNQVNLDSWASRNKTYVTTIADHSFYM